MADKIADVTRLLREAGKTHHTVYRISDGDDPDWASWYSDWLLNLSELSEILGSKPVRSELTYTLVKLGKEMAEKSPDRPWEEYYAEELVRLFGSD